MHSTDEYPIDPFAESGLSVSARPARGTLSYGVVAMSSGLLLLLDLVCLLVASSLSSVLYTHWLVPAGAAHAFGKDFAQEALVAAFLAPFILHYKHFGTAASREQTRSLVRSHGLRYALFVGFALVLGSATQTLDDFPRAWLALWFATGLLLTSLTRVLLARYLRRLQRQGVLAEVVAVVGAGQVADRLVHVLRQTRAENIEILGVFDDEVPAMEDAAIRPAGTLAQLIELGKIRRIDWILLTLPPTAEDRLLLQVQRLKALAVPIGLCSQHVGLTLQYHPIDYVADGVPVSLLADRPMKRWDAVVTTAEDSMPRWIITSVILSLMALKALVAKICQSIRAVAPRQGTQVTLPFDDLDVVGFAEVAAGFGQDRYGYVVTPNADHMIRLHGDAAFRASYSAADYMLLDSRFLSHVLRLTRRIRLPVCCGSDLTATLFGQVIASDDRLVLIGASDRQARELAELYGLRDLVHFNPKMGFIGDPQAVETCLRFIEKHSPFRFCFLALGSPQQEALAQQLKSRGVARGLTLCIGASINFLTGDELRAPYWMQRAGIEWLFRLIQDPARMAQRYLVRGPRIFGLLRRTQIVLRKGSLLPPPASPSEPACLASTEREDASVSVST